MAKKRKIRADFRKNRTARTRQDNWTRRFEANDGEIEDIAREERVSGKGELTRKRTLVVDESGNSSPKEGESTTNMGRGRVTSIHGLSSVVRTTDGRDYRCATRRILKTLSTDQRHVVAVGDWVRIRTVDNSEGFIEQIEPRSSAICRTVRGRQHVIAANVDQLLIIASAAEPYLKPNLIDRYVICAEKDAIRPIICINKVDLVDPADLQPLVGVYSQLGYTVLQLSATAKIGIGQLRNVLIDRASVLAGQSGVGKSSLLNAIAPGFELAVRSVSEESQKGRHTTTSARLLPLIFGGYVVDTPGIRQFQLWDVVPQEVAGYFREIRPYVSHCRFPDCTHTHEDACAVKAAVAGGRIHPRRYESYCHLVLGDDG